MNDYGYRDEMDRIRRNGRRGMVFSVVAHILFLLWLLLRPPVQDAGAGELLVVEWIDPAPAAAAPAPAPEPVVEPEPAPTTPAKAPERFEREHKPARVEPTPQKPRALSDALASKLVVQPKAPGTPAPQLAATTPTRSTRPAAAVAPTTTGRALELKREESRPGAPALELNREATPKAPSPSRPLASLATPSAERVRSTRLPADAPRREVEGATIMGDVADRAVEELVLPTYPSSARREGTEAQVTVGFVVLADGRLSPGLRIVASGGHPDFDRAAREALARWRFVAIPGAGPQAGQITFHFRLNDGR